MGNHDSDGAPSPGKAFGLTGAEFARVFDVSERTVRGWEAGRRDRKSEPVVVPRPIAVLVRLALKHASVRLELGIPSKGKAAADKKNASRSETAANDV